MFKALTELRSNTREFGLKYALKDTSNYLQPFDGNHPEYINIGYTYVPKTYPQRAKAKEAIGENVNASLTVSREYLDKFKDYSKKIM